MEKITIIIPAYNEEKRIGKTLQDYISYFKNLKNKRILDFEIIVVLNGCKDNTIGVVKKYKSQELKSLEFERVGKGFAIIEGFKEALRGNSRIIGFTDADGATPPEAFYDLVRNIKNAEGIIANRWDKKSNIKTRETLLRRFISRGGNFIIRSMFILPHQDTQCGAKLFRKDILAKVVPRLGSSEWSFDVDLLFYMRREKARIKSIPTTWEDKRGSKLNIKKTPLKTLCSITRLRLVHSPFKFIIRAHNKLPEKWKINSLINRIK